MALIVAKTLQAIQKQEAVRVDGEMTVNCEVDGSVVGWMEECEMKETQVLKP